MDIHKYQVTHFHMHLQQLHYQVSMGDYCTLQHTCHSGYQLCCVHMNSQNKLQLYCFLH